MTYPAISSGENRWFIITGSAKKQALQQVLFGERDLDLYPSQGVQPTKWFVDAGAVE